MPGALLARAVELHRLDVLERLSWETRALWRAYRDGHLTAGEVLSRSGMIRRRIEFERREAI